MLSTAPQLLQNGSSMTFLTHKKRLVGKNLWVILYCRLCNRVDFVIVNDRLYIFFHFPAKSTPSLIHLVCALGMICSSHFDLNNFDLTKWNGVSVPFISIWSSISLLRAESGSEPAASLFQRLGMARHQLIYFNGFKVSMRCFSLKALKVKICPWLSKKSSSKNMSRLYIAREKKGRPPIRKGPFINYVTLRGGEGGSAETWRAVTWGRGGLTECDVLLQGWYFSARCFLGFCLYC